MSLFVGKSAFRPHNADFLSDIPSFAESTRISLAESETVARPFRRILLPQSRSLYSLHIRASANTTSLLRYALIYLENGIGKNKRHERNLTYLRPEIMADRRRTDDNKGAREVVAYLTEERNAGRIQYLILSEKNLGKGGAWNVIFQRRAGRNYRVHG